MREAFTSVNSIGKVLFRIRDSITQKDKGNLIYKVTCQDSDTVYVDEISRALTEGIHGHRNLSKKVPKNNVEFENWETSSAIALHSMEQRHLVNFNQPETLSKNWLIYIERIAAEQWFISHEPTACNTKKESYPCGLESFMRTILFLSILISTHVSIPHTCIDFHSLLALNSHVKTCFPIPSSLVNPK